MRQTVDDCPTTRGEDTPEHHSDEYPGGNDFLGSLENDEIPISVGHATFCGEPQRFLVVFNPSAHAAFPTDDAEHKKSEDGNSNENRGDVNAHKARLTRIVETVEHPGERSKPSKGPLRGIDCCRKARDLRKGS